MMTQTVLEVRPGVVLIRQDTALPQGVQLHTYAFTPGWQMVADAAGAQVDWAITKAGWHFFYLAPELEASAFARDANGRSPRQFASWRPMWSEMR